MIDDMFVVDSHVHVFPDKIALKAMNNIYNFYEFTMPKEPQCTFSQLQEICAAQGVDVCIVHSTALAVHAVETINTWLSSLKSPAICPFGTLHLDYPDIPKEIDRMISLGLKGVKLHPDMQEFNIDDERAMPIYEACAGKLPILIHLGDPRVDFSNPRRLATVLDRFPDLVCIGAHLGGYTKWETGDIDPLYGRDNLYFDTSSAISFMTPELAETVIRRHGIDKILFGTDYPVSTADKQLQRFFEINLSPEEREKILGLNAAKLLNIPVQA